MVVLVIGSSFIWLRIAWGICLSSFALAIIPTHHFAPTALDDIYLGAVGYGLSNLAYDNGCIRSNPPIGNMIPPFLTLDQQSHLQRMKVKEKQWLKALKVREYKVWNYIHSDVLDYDKTLSQAITGTVDIYDHASSDSSSDKTITFPFIAFRGTTSWMEWSYNLQTIIEDNVDMGSGFHLMLSRLLDLQGHLPNVTITSEVARLMDDHHNRLLIAGHSLGGGAANLFYLQLETQLKLMKASYPEQYPALSTAVLDNENIHVITFAAPRAMTKELSEKMNSMKGNHLRFVNIADAITVGMRAKFSHAGKAIFPYNPDVQNGVNEDPDLIAAVTAHKYKWRTIYDPKSNVVDEVIVVSATTTDDNKFNTIIAQFENTVHNFDSGYSKQLVDFPKDGFGVHRLQTITGYGSYFHNYLQELMEFSDTNGVIERKIVNLLKDMCLIEIMCSVEDLQR